MSMSRNHAAKETTSPALLCLFFSLGAPGPTSQPLPIRTFALCSDLDEHTFPGPEVAHC